MKIALCGRFHTKRRYQGGSAEVFLALAKELSKEHDISLFGRGEPTEDIKKMCSELQVKYYWIPADSLLEILVSPFTSFILLFKKLTDEEIINTHTGCFAISSLFFRNKRKIITNIHEVLAVKNRPILEIINGYLENFMLFLGAKYSDLTIVNTEFIKELIHLKGIKNVTVISNGVSKNFFTDKKPKSKNNINMLYVGRLAISKNIPTLIKTALILREKTTLNIVGDGGIKNELMKIIVGNKQCNVIFHGRKTGNELLKFYKSADVFLMASDYEGLPLVLLEAMASGVPIIASNVRGIADLVGDRGILVDPPTAENFAFEIDKLIKSNSLRSLLIERGREYAKQFYWGKIAKIYESRYKTILGINATEKPKQIFITTSWDDGCKRDFRLVLLLKKYNLKCTFYISPKNREWEKTELMSEDEIKKVGEDFEIGAHSMTHPVLTKLSEEDAYKEIYESKIYLENIIKNEVKCFSYPRGAYNERIKELVKKAGFIGARTDKRYFIDFPSDPFAFGTTIHTYNQKSDIFKILRFSKLNLLEFYKNLDWEYLAKRRFDYILKNGGIFHLWGHSWEMDRYNQWDKLEKVFIYISNRVNLKYLTNSEVIMTYNTNGKIISQNL
ncbi:MAG: glycosyltransferase [Candidatus Humimicrobiaceae bacterium]